MSFPLNTYRFKNGIRLIHSQNQSPVAHFGLIVQTGTRDEKLEEHGMAHFMEHMFFKGTGKRSAYQIISRLEDVGGEINAYTTKEETALYASFLKEDYRRAMELIRDIFLNSTFPEKEMEKEREVILNEIQSYDDSPAELIFDRAEEILFPDHAIGRNILGSENSLKSFRRDHFFRFLEENYSSETLVLSFTGNTPFEQVVKTAEAYFGSIPARTRQQGRRKPMAASAVRIREKRDTYQKHCMLIGEGYALTDERRLGLYLLNNILGGPGLNSRLNLALRERHGYSYSAESHYAPYLDTGAIMIYFSCDPDKFQPSLKVCREELSKLRTRLIPESKLHNFRKQMIGQLAISRENNEHFMLTSGKNFLIFNRMASLKEIWKHLEAISPQQIRDTANEVLNYKMLNQLIFE